MTFDAALRARIAAFADACYFSPARDLAARAIELAAIGSAVTLWAKGNSGDDSRARRLLDDAERTLETWKAAQLASKDTP